MTYLWCTSRLTFSFVSLWWFSTLQHSFNSLYSTCKQTFPFIVKIVLFFYFKWTHSMSTPIGPTTILRMKMTTFSKYQLHMPQPWPPSQTTCVKLTNIDNCQRIRGNCKEPKLCGVGVVWTMQGVNRAWWNYLEGEGNQHWSQGAGNCTKMNKVGTQTQELEGGIANWTMWEGTRLRLAHPRV